MAGQSTAEIFDKQDMEFKEADFRAIATLLHEETGIFLADSKATLVYSRISKRLRKLGMLRFADYRAFIQTDEGTEERQNMVAALTTNITSFYREKHHFDDFGSRVLPGLLKRAEAGGKVRIWSAACSSGEEPYSIAFEVLKLAPDAHRFDIKILATDIDHDILAKARNGVYPESVAHKLPGGAKSAFLSKSGPQGGMITVGDAAKRLITFRRLNLIEPWPVSGPFDVVFCRNVTIYFNPETRAKIWEKFATILDHEGQLYVGHSERVSGAASRHLINNGVTAYKHAMASA